MAFRIRILYTGGTIGCVGRPLAPMSGPEFRDAFEALIAPAIAQAHPDAVLSLAWLTPALDSSNLQPADWTVIARHILGAPGEAIFSEHDAFIVLHGTDTMAWTASALSFLLTGVDANGAPEAPLDKPVILTGAQRPLFHRDDGGHSVVANTDALRNLLGAVACARAGIAGVGLYFNDTLYQGNRALKTSTADFNAFSSPNAPPLARLGIRLETLSAAPGGGLASGGPASGGPVSGDALARAQAQLAHAAKTIDARDVAVVPASPASAAGPLAAMLEALAESPRLGGLLLLGYGSGNLPTDRPDDPRAGAVFRALERAHEAGAVLLAGTQVTAGRVTAGTYAAGTWLADAGAISPRDMTVPCAQAKLLVLLALRDADGRNWTQGDIETLMGKPIAGEIR
ncbi:asparaginase domain-containing protein [Breoghania sp. L-A4]|uniref:asparaginase domain-containing protein n=1 Tax=Breoghania sp. L-A4 TaxID=2304600 RepID=UPI0013C32C49|nr:asparaginase domain-containing protein [Breoghania sp. L-A4]